MNTRQFDNVRALLLAVLALLTLAACGNGDEADESHTDAAAAEAAPITNRIDVPSAVRRNLGITFAKAEMRDVRSTLRVPGKFESLPDAHRSYHATLSGQVELLVKQYAPVEVGDVLFRIDSPAWREIQTQLADTILAVRKLRAKSAAATGRLASVSQHASSLLEELKVWQERLKEIEGIGAAGGGVASARTEARASVAVARTALAEVAEEAAELKGTQSIIEAELAAHRAATPLLYAEAVGASAEDCAGATCDLALSRAAALLGVTVAFLREDVGTNGKRQRRWRALDRIEVRARQAGIVETLGVTNGAWLDVGRTVLETLDPTLIRFRGLGLQADLGRLGKGMRGRVLPPGGRAVGVSATLEGEVTIGIEADAMGRTIDLLLTPSGTERPLWARPDVSTEMEVIVVQSRGKGLAIPLQCVIQDGLDKIIFRRDPKDPNKVIRMKADLGITDGRWVVVESGVMEGDEIVHAGVYELMLVGGGGDKQEGGHFHADGTFHAGPDH